MRRQDPEISLYRMIFGFRILAHRPKVEAMRCKEPFVTVSLHKIQLKFIKFNMKQLWIRVCYFIWLAQQF
jgi:hypothetical protein